MLRVQHGGNGGQIGTITISGNTGMQVSVEAGELIQLFITSFGVDYSVTVPLRKDPAVLRKLAANCTELADWIDEVAATQKGAA